MDRGRGRLVELKLLILAKERVALHLFRRRLQEGAQGLHQAELGRVRWRGLLIFMAGQGQLAGPRVCAFGYLHLVEVSLQLGLLLEEEPLLVQPGIKRQKGGGLSVRRQSFAVLFRIPGKPD